MSRQGALTLEYLSRLEEDYEYSRLHSKDEMRSNSSIDGGGFIPEDHDKKEFEGDCEIDVAAGFSSYRDPVTQSLGLLASTWDSLHKAWQATQHRSQYGAPNTKSSLADYSSQLKDLRDSVGSRMTKELKSHVLYSWLKSHPGVGGVHTCRVLSMIGDPLRFPGRKCLAGNHHLPSDWDLPCPFPVERDGEWVACDLAMGDLRRGKGVRALWHYAGLHVVDGHLAKKRKGVQATWNPAMRTALLQPDGVADQIIKHRTEPWRSVYDRTKEIIGLRSAESLIEIDERCSAPKPVFSKDEASKTDRPTEIESIASPSLRPFMIHRIARIVAVKAFVADLLIAWKSLI